MPVQNEDDNFDKRRLTWEFFKLHANQRVTFFRFYISAIIALSAAYFYIYDHLGKCNGTLFLNFCLITVGLGVIAISIVFRRIDSRNVELINNAKHASKDIEKLSHNDNGIYPHMKIFKNVFSATSILGIVLAILGGVKLGLDVCQCDLLYAHVAIASAPRETHSNSNVDKNENQDTCQKQQDCRENLSKENSKVTKNTDAGKKPIKNENDNSINIPRPLMEFNINK